MPPFGKEVAAINRLFQTKEEGFAVSEVLSASEEGWKLNGNGPPETGGAANLFTLMK